MHVYGGIFIEVFHLKDYAMKTWWWLIKLLLNFIFFAEAFDLLHKNRFQGNSYKKSRKHMLKTRSQYTIENSFNIIFFLK